MKDVENEIASEKSVSVSISNSLIFLFEILKTKNTHITKISLYWPCFL